jgi:hypothetical protein
MPSNETRGPNCPSGFNFAGMTLSLTPPMRHDPTMIEPRGPKDDRQVFDYAVPTRR